MFLGGGGCLWFYWCVQFSRISHKVVIKKVSVVYQYMVYTP